jgi:His-Xaa-Ser system protein HxsD
LPTDPHIINFDSAVFSVESVQKAVYRMGNKIFASISLDRNLIRLEIEVKDKKATIEEISNELRQTVNDYSLREKISAETKEVRNVVLATAFSRVVSQENE